MTTKRIFAPGRMLLVSAIALGAGAAHAQETTLSFLHKWPEPENMEYFEAAVAEFEEANPDIDVEMEAVADEPYKDKIRVLMASDQVPDIYFSWSGEFANNFNRAGRSLDITDAIYETDWLDAFSEASLGPFKFEGRQYGVPVNVDAKYMIYNTTIFEENGLEPPETFEDLIAICGTLTEAGVTPIGFGNQFPWAASHYLGEMIAKLVPNDVRVGDFALTRPAEELYTHPGYERALEALSRLEEEGCFNRGSNALTHAIARGSFTSGRTAMIFMQLVEFGRIADTPIDESGWDFFRFPAFEAGEGDQKMLTGAPDGFMISADTENEEAAIRFLRFLTSPEQARKYVDITGMTSSVKGSITEENADALTLKGLDILNDASGMALWLDTDMDARSTEAMLAGSQGIINGDETPANVMEEVRATAREVKAEREG